jgi:hypothetical protein
MKYLSVANGEMAHQRNGVSAMAISIMYGASINQWHQSGVISAQQ